MMEDLEESTGIVSSNNQNYPWGVGILNKVECVNYVGRIHIAVMKNHYSKGEYMDPKKLKAILDQMKASILNEWEHKTNLKNLQRSKLEDELINLSGRFLLGNVYNKISSDKTRAPSIGIHLGENNCCISVLYKGQVRIIPNQEDGGTLKTPSYVTFNPDGSQTFGLKAKENAWKNPANTIYDLMRIIGREFGDPQFQKDMKSWPFVFQEDEGVPKLKVNGKLISSEEILGKLLAYFRGMAEKYLQLGSGTVKKAVIALTPGFSSKQRQAVEKTWKLAGFETVRVRDYSFISTMAYYYGLEEFCTDYGRNLTYYFGAKSLVTTVLKETSILKFKEVTDNGGEHIDNTIMDYCASTFKAANGNDLFAGQDSIVMEERDAAKRRLNRLKAHCERAQIKLTTETTAPVISIDGIMQGLDLNVEVTRKTFEELNQALFERSIRQVEETIKEAGLEKDDIQGVILAGSGSKIPKVQEMLEAYFGDKILKCIDPEYVVPHGAAFEAAWMNYDSNSDQKYFIVTADAALPKNPDIATAVTREFEISNAKLFIANSVSEYIRLMKTEETHPQTVIELENTHKETTDVLVGHMRKNCAIGDAALQLDYERKLRATTKTAFDKIRNDYSLERSKTLEGEIDTTLQRVTAKIIKQIKSRMNSAIEDWLQDHLTQDNIPEVRNVYDHLLTNVLGGGDGQLAETSLWAEFEEIICEECQEIYTSYLDVVHEYLFMFHQAIQSIFTAKSCFTNDELEVCFLDEYDKVINILKRSNSEICQLVKVGCGKLMGYYREQNNKIREKERALANKIMPDLFHFYDEEMARYLTENIYPQDQLKRIHLSLVDKLAESFETAFKFTSTDKVCDIVPTALAIMREELGLHFIIHLQQNQEKSRKIEEELGKILETSKSSYVSLVDNMMKEKPEGVDPTEFERMHGETVNNTKEQLKAEIREKTGQEGSLAASLALLQVQIDKHWAFVSELNSLSWRKSKLMWGMGREGPAEVGRSATQVADRGHRGHTVEETQVADRGHTVEETQVADRGHRGHTVEETQVADRGHRGHTVEETAESSGSIGRSHDVESPGAVGVDALTSAKKQLLDQSNEIKNQLERGTVFTIKTSLVKNKFAKKIQDAIDCAQSPDSTEDQIEGHRAELVKWSSKYKK